MQDLVTKILDEINSSMQVCIDTKGECQFYGEDIMYVLEQHLMFAPIKHARQVFYEVSGSEPFEGATIDQLIIYIAEYVELLYQDTLSKCIEISNKFLDELRYEDARYW